MEKETKVVNQHYVQKRYLQNFLSKDNKTFYVYNLKAEKIYKSSPKKVCFEKYTYESQDEINNKLENHIKRYEDLGIKVINKIIERQELNTDDFPFKELGDLYNYIYLQLLRTNAGRIIYESVKDSMEQGIDNAFSVPREHIDNDEIGQNETLINRFNTRAIESLDNFDNEITSLWKYLYPYMGIEIHKSNNLRLLTSDNPVFCGSIYKQIIVENRPKKIPSFSNMKLAISPYLMVEIYISTDFLRQGNIVINNVITDDDVKSFNRNIISNSNYFIISPTEFSKDEEKLLLSQTKRMKGYRLEQ